MFEQKNWLYCKNRVQPWGLNVLKFFFTFLFFTLLFESMAISSDSLEDYRAQKSLFNTPVWDPGGILCPFEHNIVNPPRLIAPARIRFYYRTLQINPTQAAVSPCVFNLPHHRSFAETFRKNRSFYERNLRDPIDSFARGKQDHYFAREKN